MNDYSIAKVPYKNHNSINEKILPEDWINFVDSRPEILWLENTELGRNMPITNPRFREKRSARTEWYPKKGYYHLLLTHYDYGYVAIQLNSVITPKRLRYLLEISKGLNALLLKNGTKIINEAYIEQLENKKKKKTE